MYHTRTKKFCWHCKADHMHSVDVNYPDGEATVNYECLQCGTHSSAPVQALKLTEEK